MILGEKRNSCGREGEDEVILEGKVVRGEE